MQRRVRLVAILLSIGAIAIGFSLIAAQSPDDSEPDSYTRSDTREGAFRFDLPVGEHACRFISNYDGSEADLPSGYIDASAWLNDENGDTWPEFTLGDTKFVSVTAPLTDAESEMDAWAAQLAQAFRNLSLYGIQVSIRDSTPRLEIDLSRGFRQAKLEWTFQCVEFAWPE